MDDLREKVAVVTGAASGIGLAMAHAFADEGMKVVLADVDEPGLHAARAGLAEEGASAIGVVTDVSDPAAVEALRDAAVSAFGGAHVVCNNAGVAGGGPTWQIPLETWRWVFAVNFWGVVHGIHSFVPLLLEQGEGHVVNTASAAGIIATPLMSPYTATKHAVVVTSETLAMELAGQNVGVSVLCPMWVRTRIHESDRNAPVEVVAASEVSQGEGGGALMGEGMRDVVRGFIESGLDPAVVAGEVVAAVKANRFWIFPHPEVTGAALERGTRISEQRNPTFELGELLAPSDPA